MATQEIFGRIQRKKEPRPVPVYVLADVSGSMHGRKIQNLNQAIDQMIRSFIADNDDEITFHLAVVTFGSTAQLHIPLTPVEQVRYTPLTAGGGTNLRDALILVKQLIEDRTKQPARSMKPAVTLISDGRPNSGYNQAFEQFINEGKTKGIQRFAIGIGGDADMVLLDQFQNIDEIGVLNAHSAEDVVELLDRIRGYTTTVAQATSQMIGADVPARPNSPSHNLPKFQFPSTPSVGTSSSIIIDDEDEDDFI